jgi:AbrB family looped-hinge helix DNA binding protein
MTLEHRRFRNTEHGASNMTKEGRKRLVKSSAKGRVTIPADFRERLGIGENTILQMELKSSCIVVTPLRMVDEDRLLWNYDTLQVEDFLEEDSIDPETAAKVRDSPAR